MALYYGVRCKRCGEYLEFGRLEMDGDKQMTFYAAPLAPVKCGNCGVSCQYSSDDIVKFEVPDDPTIGH